MCRVKPNQSPSPIILRHLAPLHAVSLISLGFRYMRLCSRLERTRLTPWPSRVRISIQVLYRDGIVPRGSTDGASELDCGVMNTTTSAHRAGGSCAADEIEDGQVNLHVLSSQLELCDGRESSWQHVDEPGDHAQDNAPPPMPIGGEAGVA